MAADRRLDFAHRASQLGDLADVQTVTKDDDERLRRQPRSEAAYEGV